MSNNNEKEVLKAYEEYLATPPHMLITYTVL